jgi:histidyl-tRNA synthetase
MIQRPRGTRDFSPDEMVIRRVIEQRLHSTAIRFGYQEVATPTFEHAELFIRKSGAEIVEQLYLFRDKGERELVLRPELTAPVIRFYANDLFKQPKPLKLFYFGNCFRYERPQKGRFREFWQFGAELLGTDKPEGIAELIVFAHACITNNSLKNFELRVGYLEILKNILSSWDISGSQLSKLMVYIDKGDLDPLRTELQDNGLTDDQINSFFELVMEKFKDSEIDQRCMQLAEQFPLITDNLERLKSIVQFMKTFGVGNITIDLGIARGLDYYTGVVFEIDITSLGAEKQVCGGGEYSLDEMFNLKDVPCSGFAIGFDRMVLAFESEGLKPPELELDIYIAPLAAPCLVRGIEISNTLRNAGFKVDLDIKGRNMSKNLKFASSRGAKFVVFIGDDELAQGTALVRTMSSGEQSNVKFEELGVHFQKLLSS